MFGYVAADFRGRKDFNMVAVTEYGALKLVVGDKRQGNHYAAIGVSTEELLRLVQRLGEDVWGLVGINPDCYQFRLGREYL